MLTWDSSTDSRFISGNEEGVGEMVLIAVGSKKIVHLSRDCSPAQFRQVADKLEELQGTKKEEHPGGVSEDSYRIKKSRSAGNYGALYNGDKQLGYFCVNLEEDSHQFHITNSEGLTPSEGAKVEELLKHYNFKL